MQQDSEHVKAVADKSEDFRLHLAKLRDFLSKNSVCEDTSISLLASLLSPVPPIFVDVPVTVMSGVSVPKRSTSELQEQDCMTYIADIIGLEGLSLSSHKSTKAKNHIFW